MNEDDLLKDADAKLAQNEIELLGCYDVHPEPYENDPEAADARRAFLDHLLAPFFARIRELEAHTATYRAQVDAVLKDRALILAERDRTFALMLARAEAAEADARSWRTVALSNQAASQSHQERWAKAESERDRMRDALIDILDTGGAFGTAARPVRIDLIARAALTAPSAKPKE